MKELLNFSTNAKLEKLIGRELITNNVIAIFELIKNSYDAFASTSHIQFINFDTSGEDNQMKKSKERVISDANSKLIITDNGKGMSYDEVKRNWMEIGATGKENIVETEKIVNNSIQRRVINGEKGIGRFGTDKLGSKLRMISIGLEGYEKTTIDIDWSKFDNHSKTIQEISFECNVERLSEPSQTGVRLEITSLRDAWTNSDILKLKRQLKKLISPFAQEKDIFKIYLDFDSGYSEQIVNDSFDFATTGINASIDKEGVFNYEIFTSLDNIKFEKKLPQPKFGPVKLKILYMDRAAKNAFTRRTGITTKDYGNIKVFRDNFRVLPYGEAENDWLKIDSAHAQGAFRTFATRDLVGYVQISKEYNSMLRDATSRQGLNEDIIEFELFKDFIWDCIHILQDYVFRQIKSESEKQGEVIKGQVKQIQREIYDFRKELPLIYRDVPISNEDKEKLIEKTSQRIESIDFNVKQVEQANKQLSSRIKVMEKIVGAENRVYDMLHAIKNRLAALESMINNVQLEAEKKKVNFNSSFAKKIVSDVSSLVLTAMRRTSPRSKKKDTVILSEVINEFIEENKQIYPDVVINYKQTEYCRIFVNVEELKISLENLLDNSIKAMKNEKEKLINIHTRKVEKSLKLIFEDNGIGIAREYAPFIFNVSFSKTNGTGIGLSTVLDFMKEQGGDINLLESGSLKGAAFELTFPLKGGIL